MATDRETAKNMEIIREQLGKVRLLYPELYEFLVERERDVRGALIRIPHPVDPEWMLNSGELEQLVGRLKSLQERGFEMTAEFDSGKQS